jgi:tRNA uridine 5-carbamoylmethylation protein Kti12
MSFEKFKDFNEKLNEYFNIVTEKDSEVILKEYESYLQSTSKSNIIIIDPINNII